MVQEQPSRNVKITHYRKLKEGRWPELYFSSEQFPLNIRALMERAWIKTCVKVQFPPLLLTQAEQPWWTALQNEFVFLLSKLIQTFLHPKKKKKLGLFPLFQHCSVLATSVRPQLPVAMLGCWFQELLRQCGFNSQQIAPQMFQTLGQWSDASLKCTGQNINPVALLPVFFDFVQLVVFAREV